MLSLIREWDWVKECEKWFRGPVPVLTQQRHAGEEIAKCGDCHRLLRIRYYNKLILHLSRDHRLSENAAIETTNWIMDKTYRMRMENIKAVKGNL